MIDAAVLLHRLGGVARGQALQQQGLSRKALADQVERGQILRLRPGVFARDDTDVAIRTAAAHGGTLTCESALQLHGVWTLNPVPLVHVWLGTGGRRHAHSGCCCTSHFFAGPTRFGVASVETALVHLYYCAGSEAFFVAFESACRQRLLSASARSRVRSNLPASARWLVDFARFDADSGLESLLRLRLRLLGLPLRCQVVIDGVGRVDFVVDDWLIIEVDGRLNHDGPSLRHKDLARDAAASARGYETLRFDYAQIMHDWPAVHASIVAARARLRARVC